MESLIFLQLYDAKNEIVKYHTRPFANSVLKEDCLL